MILRKLQSEPVGDDGGLTDGDIGKGSCMDKNGLSFNGLHQGWIDGLGHKCCHGAVNFKVRGRNSIAFLVPGNLHFSYPVAHILKIASHGKYSHKLRGDGNLESAFHHEAVHLAAHSNNYLPKGLSRKVNGPSYCGIIGIYIETFQVLFCQHIVAVVELMLSPGGHRHHGKVMSVGYGIDVSGQPETEFSQGNTLAEASAGSRSLDIKSGSAGGLTDCTGYLLSERAQSLD